MNEGCWWFHVFKIDSVLKYETFWQLTSTKTATFVTEVSHFCENDTLLCFMHSLLCVRPHKNFDDFGFSVQDEKGKGRGGALCVCMQCDRKTFLHNHNFPEKTACLVWAKAMPRVEQLFINWVLSCHSVSQSQYEPRSNQNILRLRLD